MKTKNAFAFRDFDRAKILQRPFFKDFHFDADKSDTEILQDLSLSDDDSFETIQKKFDILDTLIVSAAKYQNRIKRHGDRLTKYARAVANKIATDDNAEIEIFRTRHKRANELSMKYCGCVTDTKSATTFFLGGITVDDIGGLCQRIAERYKELDEKIKIHYRKIFASRLKTARQAMKLSQTDFGASVGLSQRVVSSYEVGIREPNLATLVRFSQKLKRPVGWFLGAE